MTTGGGDEPRGRLARGYARAVARLGWLVVAVWVAGAAAAVVWLPSLPTGKFNLGSLIPPGSHAAQTQSRLLHDFPFPLQSNTLVVVHDGHGLPALSQLDVLLYALSYDQRAVHLPRPLPDNRVLGALPVFDTAHLFPGSRQSGTTTVTYLFFSPDTSLESRVALAERYAAHFRSDPGVTVRVSGTVPARWAQSQLVLGHLHLVEIATLVFAALVVAVSFRSLIAPLVTLAAAFLSYVVASRVLGHLAVAGHVVLPPPLEPLVVALVLGILTDYSVFFFTEARDRMLAGDRPGEALRASLRHNIPIVAAAGVAVTAGTASLYAASLQLFRQFAPGLAISVFIGALSAMTFVPAVMAILGRHTYWPSRPAQADDHRPVGRLARWPVRMVSRRPGAVVALVLCVGGLGAAAWPLLHARLDASFIRSLPADAPVREGADLAQRGFVPGVLGPIEVLLHGGAATSDTEAVARLQDLLGRQPGMAASVGPGNIPVLGTSGVFVSRTHDEARVLLFGDADPLGGRAIAEFRALRSRMPGLVRAAGLSGVTARFAGDTAVAAEAADATSRNLERVLLVAFGAELLILIVFLRALVAPLLLLAASGLVVAAAFGLTTWVFQDHLHSEGLTFYAPFATGVLLIALGSDYNVFAAGRIWQSWPGRRLRRAIRRAMPESSKAITTAGFTLAGSFALVSLVPLLQFREMAFTVVVGLLVDTFVIRSLLTPAVLTLVGPVAGWPNPPGPEPETGARP